MARSRKQDLRGALHYAFAAGAQFMRRTHWLLKAHQATDQEMRGLYVGFAKSAHRAYLNDLRRVFQHS